MDTQRATPAPIFTAESGTRATVLQWLARGLCLGCALVAGAVAFTLMTHVPLPGLGGLLDPGTSNGAPLSGRGGAGNGDREVGDDAGAGSAARDAASVARTQAAARDVVRRRATASTGTGSGAVAGPKSAAAVTNPTKPAPSPNANASTNSPNPHAATKSPNPHAATKSPNPNSVDKTKNPRAVAGSANARPSGRPSSTPSAATR